MEPAARFGERARGRAVRGPAEERACRALSFPTRPRGSATHLLPGGLQPSVRRVPLLAPEGIGDPTPPRPAPLSWVSRAFSGLRMPTLPPPARPSKEAQLRSSDRRRDPEAGPLPRARPKPSPGLGEPPPPPRAEPSSLGGRRNNGPAVGRAASGSAVLRCPLAAGPAAGSGGRESAALGPGPVPPPESGRSPTMVARATRLGSARPASAWQAKVPGEQQQQQQQRWPSMTAAQKCSFFPQQPYYVPGYGGFYPQVRYHVGQSYGRTTSRMLTDPEVRKSPCSVLTPLKRPKFTEDFSQQKLPAPDRMDQGQSYIPGYTGFIPYTGCFPIPSQDLQLPLPRVLPRPDPPLWTEGHPGPAHRKVISCHPGIRLACGPGWRQFASTASSQLVSPKDEQRFLCHPDIALVCGQEESRGPCKAGMSLVCGQGWRGPPCRAGTDQPTRTEGVPLPLATETVDVRRFDRIPKLDLPNLIQRKAISGYAGFIPCFTWIMGVNYLKGVKDAMNNFDRNQERLRNPIYSFGQRLPHTYWPNTKIYNSRGLVPFYTGFVPTIREHYALTFGNSTRKAFYDEVQHRQHTG